MPTPATPATPDAWSDVLPAPGPRPRETPFVEFDREAWSRLAAATPLPLTARDIVRLRALGDPIDLDEVDVVYRPLSRLLTLNIEATRRLHGARSTFLRDRTRSTPYVIGVAGSVAVGKSTTSRLLREMMRRWPETPTVDLVTTDGFLLPNAELERQGLMDRKGFPESYDRRALLQFIARVKAGAPEVAAPVYSHLRYDIVPDHSVVVRRPDVLIVEGLNVLQPARLSTEGGTRLAVSDFFDFSIFVDARVSDIERWYIDRFLKLRRTTFAQPDSYFHRYATLNDEAAARKARQIWAEINGPNLEENILPTRGRATLVLTKGPDHSVQRIRLRKL